MINKIKGKTLAFKLKVLATTLVVLIAALTITAFAATAANSFFVDIYENGAVTRVETSKQDFSAVLAEAKKEIGENDKIDSSSFKAGEESRIEIYRYSAVSVITTDKKTTQTNFAGTVGELLTSLNITLLADDVVNYSLYTAVSDGMNIVIEKACLVSITADGAVTQARVGFVKVSDAIASSGVLINDDDIVTPDRNADVSDGMEITINRVTYQQRTTTQKIAFNTVSEKSSAFLVGTKQVTQNGSDGAKTVIYSDKYVDGVLTESTVKSEKVTKKAVNKIVTTGTGQKAVSTSALGGCISELKIPSKLTVKNGAPTSYKSVVRGKACAYTADKSAKTASGRTVKPGYVAVNPNQFPYGTELYIFATDGTVYGYAIAADTGGFVKQGKFTVDLFMNTYNQCINWGAKDVIIYVL